MSPASTHKAVASKETAAKSSHSLLGSLDMMDQLILLLVGVGILLVNLGLIDHQLLAYWPLVLIVVALKAMLQGS